jgi:hypothetical protein
MQWPVRGPLVANAREAETAPGRERREGLRRDQCGTCPAAENPARTVEAPCDAPHPAVSSPAAAVGQLHMLAGTASVH